MMVTPNQCPINASNPSSHNTVDGGEDEEESNGVNDEMIYEDLSNVVAFTHAEDE